MAPRFINAAKRQLEAPGWKLEGNLDVERRGAGVDPTRLQSAAAEIVALRREVVLVLSVTEVRALRKASATVPIVFCSAIDPVADGIVESLARPGGQTTGFTNYEPSIATIWLGLLKEMVPSLRRVATVLNPDYASLVALRRAVVDAAPSLDVALTIVGDRSARDRGRAPGFRGWRRRRLVGPSRRFDGRRSRAHRAVGSALASARRLSLCRLCASRRAHVLRHRSDRPIPAWRGLGRSHSPRCEAERPSGTGAGEIRARRQSQDGRSDGALGSGAAPRPRRRGHRMRRRTCDCHWSRLRSRDSASGGFNSLPSRRSVYWPHPAAGERWPKR